MKASRYGLGMVVAMLLSGCMHGQGTLDAIEGEMGSQGFVEAFFEFAGPSERWAGPAPLLIQVGAKDEIVNITLSSSAFVSSLQDQKGPAPLLGPLVSNRTIASDPLKGIKSEVVREQLSYLAGILMISDQTVRGCLSPVRVRLVRADGSLFERQECRPTKGAHAISQLASYYITATVNPAGINPAAAPFTARQPEATASPAPSALPSAAPSGAPGGPSGTVLSQSAGK